MEVIRKASADEAGDDVFDFVMSDATVDRYGDVIEVEGWKLSNFKKNPIALFAHDGQSLPIGTWQNVRVEGGKLRGRLELLGRGLSARIDEIRALIEAGVLRAVSVGFRPVRDMVEAMPGNTGGLRFKAAELVECSVVNIPANPNALRVAKALGISDEARAMLFGEPANDDSAAPLRRAIGETAVKPPMKRNTKMATLAERVVDAQNELTQLKDQLVEHLKQDEADEIVTDELSAKIEKQESVVASLQRAEQALATKSDPVVQTAQPSRRPFAQAAKKTEPKDVLVRAAVVQVLAHLEKRSPLDVLQGRYGADESIKAMLDVTTKAATAPATTTTTGWAAELVQTATLDLIEQLVAKSVYPVLRNIGGRFTFGPNGIVSLPARAATPSIAGSFVGQGAPIPVRQAGFTSTPLTPKKMAVITTFTREIAEHSTPSIEGVLRQAIQEDTSVAIDTVLLDSNAATTIRPAGLRNGVSGITAADGGGFDALVADLKALVAALISSSNGNIRNPVWVMNPVQKLAISLTQNAAGDFPFAAKLEQGTLLGYPVAESATVPLGTVALVDGADFFTATGDEPRFDVSDQATLHMEDTTPLQISATGTPNTVAAPIRSMFQTDSIALRMILDMNWAMRRAGMVAFVTDVTW